MEKQQKKQVTKYVYFLCIGIVIGFLLGSVNRHDYARSKASNNRVYETDTVQADASGWYGTDI